MDKDSIWRVARGILFIFLFSLAIAVANAITGNGGRRFESINKPEKVTIWPSTR